MLIRIIKKNKAKKPHSLNRNSRKKNKLIKKKATKRYKRPQRKYNSQQPKNFFREDHEKLGLFVSWADAFDRGSSYISIQYKIKGDSKQYRSPRSKTAWLDAKDLEYAKLKTLKWKNSNNNSLGIGNEVPAFYLEHQKEYLNWLFNTARHTTIETYNSDLIRYVFPYFIKRLELNSPSKWDDDAVTRWESFLYNHIKHPETRNKKRTSLRRYLRFLKQTGRIKKRPEILNEPIKRKSSTETPIPGELPEWTDVVKWIRQLPPGRFRFIKALGAAFGTRVSESCAIEELDIFGEESAGHIDSKNDYIRQIIDANVGALFMNVRVAVKKKIDPQILRMLGEEPSKEPKSGPYTAVCTSPEMAQLVIDLIENGEHLEDLSMNSILSQFASTSTDNSEFRFSEYRSHDDRRLNITLQCLDLNLPDRIDICCQTHGHSNRETFAKYFQWGLMQKRKKSRNSSTRLKAFKIKNKEIA